MMAFTLCGCGESADHPDLGRVTGVVTLDGAPLPGAVVGFQPVQGRPSSGLTDNEGRYTLLYTADAQGAIIGTHTVSISTERYADQPDGSSQLVPEKIPAKYNKKTTLTQEVKAGSNQFNFELTSK